MSVHAWDQWKADNPDWERYYTRENTPGVGEVGEWKDSCVNPNQGGMKCSVEHKNWKKPSKTNPRLKLMPRKRKTDNPIGVGLTAKQIEGKTD